MANRKAATEFIINTMNEFAPGNVNVEIYKEKLGSLSDEEFDSLMKDLESGKTVLPYISPNLGKPTVTIDNLLKLGDKIGHEFFQHLMLTDSETGVRYRTNHKYMVMDLPVRRQRERIQKKMSLPVDNTIVDDLTGQPINASKGSSLSFPELQVLYALGLTNVPEELLRARGGDAKVFNQMNKDIIENGESSLTDLAKMGTTVKSTETLSILLKGMMLDNNL